MIHFALFAANDPSNTNPAGKTYVGVIISIVGRPNTGKSTLFNALTGSAASLTDDLPGVTRDTVIGEVDTDRFRFTLFDTAGMYTGKSADRVDSLEHKINGQIELAIDESDGVIFVTDRKNGFLPADRDIYEALRKAGKKIYFCVNKVDSPVHETSAAEFYESGAAFIHFISASHKSGLGELTDAIESDFLNASATKEKDPPDLSVAVIGRPNTGKSTLVNALLGYDRQIVHDMSGTTRDAVDSYFRYFGREVKIIDTAGIRRRPKVTEKLEKLSVLAAIRSVSKADVVVLMISAEEMATDQEMKLAAYVKKNGKPMIIAVNKWDLYPKDSNTAAALREDIKQRMSGVAYCPVLFISALNRQRLGDLVKKCFLIKDTHVNIPANQLIRVVKQASELHPIHLARGRKDKISFASLINEQPPTFLMRVKYPDSVPDTYRSYIENTLRSHFDLEARSIKIYWKAK